MSEKRSRSWLLPLAAGIAAAAAFVWLHTTNYYRAVGPIIRRAPAGSPIDEGPSLVAQVAANAFLALAIYAAFALAGAAIAAKTRDRIVWALPAALWVLSPVPGMLLLQDRPALRPLLDPYDLPGAGPGAWRIVWALADLMLVLLPGAIVAFRQREAVRRVDGHARLAFVLCGVLAALVYLRQQVANSGHVGFNTDAHLALGILFVIGAALGVKRPWFPAVHVATAFLLSEGVYILMDWAVPFGPSSLGLPARVELIGKAMLPGLAAVGFGALTEPLAGYLRRRRYRAVTIPAPATAQ